MPYILLILMWTSSPHDSIVTSVEFTSQERCEQAAMAAKTKFEGFQVTFYHVCSPK